MLRKKDNVELEKMGFKYGTKEKFIFKTKSNGIESKL